MEVSTERTHASGVDIPSSAVLNYVAAAIYSVDHAGCCTQVNPAALALMGYSESECLGRDMHSLIHATREDGSPYPPEECPVYIARIEGRRCHPDGGKQRTCG